jgi:hypothetical protein
MNLVIHFKTLMQIEKGNIIMRHTVSHFCGHLHFKMGSSVQESARMIVCNGAILFELK